MTSLHRVLTLTAALATLPAIAAAQQPGASIAGTWSLSLVGDHAVPTALVLEQNGAALKGTLTLMGTDVPVTGTLTGASIVLEGKAKVQQHGAAASAEPAAPVTLKITGTFNAEENTMTGDFAVPNGTMKWTAERLRKQPAGAPAPPMATAAAGVAGSWRLAVMVQGSSMESALELQQTGAKVTGRMVSDHLGTIELTGTFENGVLTFEGTSTAAGAETALKFTGAFKNADELSGRVATAMGELDWSAIRNKK